MKKIFVGVAALGPTDVKLFADPSTGSGHFTTNTTSGKLPELTVGLDHVAWWRCLAVLQHEANEYVLFARNNRYDKSGESASNSAAYFFWLDHQEFAEMCANTAYFEAKLGPALRRLYLKHNRKK